MCRCQDTIFVSRGKGKGNARFVKLTNTAALRPVESSQGARRYSDWVPGGSNERAWQEERLVERTRIGSPNSRLESDKG